jgi:erythromycin esterase-like protein
METLERLIAFHGKGNSKAIVWAHNTHIGDARATDMSRENMINLGQLVRERKSSNNTVLVGFGTYKGSVIAAKRWGDKMEQMKVPPAIGKSWDNILHNIKKETNNNNNNINNIKNKNKLVIFESYRKLDLILDDAKKDKGILNNDKYRGQRAIGVVYNSEYEKYGNYVPTILPLRYDVFLFIDETHALHPLHMPTIDDKDFPETFPTGV